jgi:outer membrane lipoprotein-sorting protein
VRSLFALAVTATLAVSSLGSIAWAGELSQQDRADIALVTEYLNQVKTLEADFVQASPSGQIAKGRLFLQRPNRLRFEYDAPSPLLLVADGLWLILHDRELDQVDRWPIEDTPLGVLVAKKVDLTRRTEVVGVAREPGILALTFRDKENPEEGSVTVIFSEPPLTLRQWRVVDSRGEATDLSIRNPRINVTMDPALFTFQDSIADDKDRGQ